jgi:hypothetical protein
VAEIEVVDFFFAHLTFCATFEYLNTANGHTIVDEWSLWVCAGCRMNVPDMESTPNRWFLTGPPQMDL